MSAAHTGAYSRHELLPQRFFDTFKERWFKLKDNFLFYFRISGVGKMSETQPCGVFVLEHTSIQMEHNQDIPFAFSISYIDEPDKKHIFSAMTDDSVCQWVTKLRNAPYENLRSQLYVLQSKIYLKTGKDPLLMVPRNQGSMLWAPGEPLPESNLVKSANFLSHLSPPHSKTNVARSKSFVNVLANTHITPVVEPLVNPWPNHTALGRSKTSASVYAKRRNPFDVNVSGNEFSTSKSHHRPAPSPPARMKNSPLLSRNNNNLENKHNHEPVSELGFLHPNSLSDLPPIPPQRKNSPKALRHEIDGNDLIGDNNSIGSTHSVSRAVQINSSIQNNDDLIKF